MSASNLTIWNPADSAADSKPADLHVIDDSTNDNIHVLLAMRIIATIVSVMAIGALLVASVALSSALTLLGFCVAFSMMLFIGLPLILASIPDPS